MKKPNNSLAANIAFMIWLTPMFSTAANATLLPRLDGQAVYDTDLNITWVSDASLPITQGYSGDRMNWYGAQQWIKTLNATNYLGFDDWRLPITNQPDPTCSTQWNSSWGGKSGGTNCSLSELGHLFYHELGGVASESINTTHNENIKYFKNITNNYWSDTTYESPTNLTVNFGNSYNAWHFQMGNGIQLEDSKTNDYYFNAWAVRDGDVTSIPEPSRLALTIFGVLSLSIKTILRPRKGTKLTNG